MKTFISLKKIHVVRERPTIFNLSSFEQNHISYVKYVGDESATVFDKQCDVCVLTEYRLSTVSVSFIWVPISICALHYSTHNIKEYCTVFGFANINGWWLHACAVIFLQLRASASVWTVDNEIRFRIKNYCFIIYCSQ